MGLAQARPQLFLALSRFSILQVTEAEQGLGTRPICHYACTERLSKLTFKNSTGVKKKSVLGKSLTDASVIDQ